MKKRERRRYLTKKYQQKQVRMTYSMSQRKLYDPYRYLQRPLAIKARFIDDLMGRYVGTEWSDSWRPSRTNLMLNCADELSKERIGRFKKHSWTDCGRPHCMFCSNPRRGYWSKVELTLAERRMLAQFDDDLEDYYNKDL